MSFKSCLYLICIGVFCSCTHLKIGHEQRFNLAVSGKSDALLGGSDQVVFEPQAMDSSFIRTALALGLDTFYHLAYELNPTVNQTTPDPGADATVDFLVGRKVSSGQVIIVADENSNNDLSDDKPHYFVVDPLGKGFLYSKIRLKNLSPSVIPSHLAGAYEIAVSPVINFSLRTKAPASTIALKLSFSKYLESHLRYRGRRYKIVVRNLESTATFNPNTTIITVTRKNEAGGFKKTGDIADFYKLGDSLSVGPLALKISGLSDNGKWLGITRVKQFADLNSFKELTFKNMTGHQIGFDSLANSSAHFVIDFWGSWCVPCLKSFDSLNALRARNPEINFIGIVFDDTSNAEDVRRIISSYNLPQTQFFIPRNEEGSVIERLRVFSFPTYMILDANGTIIFKGIGKEGFANLSGMLNDIATRNRKTLRGNEE